MFELARRLLRVDFVQPAEIAVEEEAELTEVVGYCATLVFSGLTRHSAPRLTDLLNASDEVDLQDDATWIRAAGEGESSLSWAPSREVPPIRSLSQR